MDITYDPVTDILVLTIPGAEKPFSEGEEVEPFVLVSDDAFGRLARIVIFRFLRRRINPKLQ